MNLKDLLKTKKEEIIRIASKHGACNIRIFGSVAKGLSNKDSDIDFLVDTTSNLSSWFPAGLIIDLENLLHIKVDIATPRALKERIKKKVLQEAIPL